MADTKKHINQTKDQTHQQILKNMSHELRTPLSGVEHALFLLKKTKLTQEQLSYLDLGEEALGHLSKQIDALIAIKEIEHIQIDEKLFNLEDEVIKLISFYQSQAKLKSIEFILTFDYHIDTFLKGDVTKIKSILRHVLDNSLKFTEQGFIHCDIKKRAQDFISFTIEDTGIGMDESNLNHMTEAFMQKDISDIRSYGGLGLGLSITHAYVKALGGKLMIESSINKGTKISFDLPLKKDEVMLFPRANTYIALTHFKKIPKDLIASIGFLESHESSPDFIFFDDESVKDIKDMKVSLADQKTKCILISSSKHRKVKDIDRIMHYPISRHELFETLFTTDESFDHEPDYQPMLSGYALIVDDNRLNRIALASILMKQGVHSKTVESGLLAIEAVKKETFDVILMDVQMPQMDGMEATRRIRALGKDFQKIPIIAVTANAYFNDYDLLKTSQMTDVIFKPIKTESLNPILRKYLKPSPEIMIPENLYIFDENEFKSRFDGSMDIAKEVIETFMIEYPKDLKKVLESITIKHAEHIIKHVHYFKGSCSYLSAQRLVWLINLMMDHAKHQNLEFMDALYQQLLGETEKLIEQLHIFLKALSLK